MHAMSGAQVTAFGPMGSIVTQTDSNGFYVFLGLLPGTYHVVAAKQGYYNNDECLSRGLRIRPDEVMDWDLGLDSELLLGAGCRSPATASIFDPDATADVYDVQ